MDFCRKRQAGESVFVALVLIGLSPVTGVIAFLTLSHQIYNICSQLVIKTRVLRLRAAVQVGQVHEWMLHSALSLLLLLELAFMEVKVQVCCVNKLKLLILTLFLHVCCPMLLLHC